MFPLRIKTPSVPIPKIGYAALSFIFIAYMIFWIIGNHEMLCDPLLQNDDVRIHVFAFHKYSGNEAIANDPVANEVINMVTPGIRGLYKALVPVVNLHRAAKIVQGICFILILLPFFMAFNKHKDNFVSIIILIFFTFHTNFLMFRTVGGFQRNFAVPTIVLWLVGSYTKNRTYRYIAILISSLTYPPALALLIVSEFLFILTSVDWKEKRRGTQFKREIKLFVALFLSCLVILAPYMIMKRNAGPVHSLREAQKEPAFGPHGRVEALPFPYPVPDMIKYFAIPLNPSGNTLLPSYSSLMPEHLRNLNLLAIAAGLLLMTIVILVLRKSTPIPKTSICLIIASVSMYILSRVFAFHFFLPERYYQYGLPLALISAIAEVLPNLKIKLFSYSNYWISFILIACVIIFLGDGITPRLGMKLDGRKNSQLYQYFRSTPPNTRIACHPNDGDDVPFWSGRPTTGGYESLQPWFVKSWQRHKALTMDVLSVLYSTDVNTIISWCRRESITHLLLNTDRYGQNFRANALMFEPFGAFLKNLLAAVDNDDLALNNAITKCATFSDGNLVVIRVENLVQIRD